MADRNVQHLPYGAAQALILWALDDWASIDGWAAAQGCDPLQLPARRLVNLIYYRMTENLDAEGKSKLDESLDRAAYIRHPLLTKPSPSPRRLRSVPQAPQTAATAPVGRWRAPEGWTPPGWSEERSYAASKAFMGWNAGKK